MKFKIKKPDLRPKAIIGNSSINKMSDAVEGISPKKITEDAVKSRKEKRKLKLETKSYVKKKESDSEYELAKQGIESKNSSNAMKRNFQDKMFGAGGLVDVISKVKTGKTTGQYTDTEETAMLNDTPLSYDENGNLKTEDSNKSENQTYLGMVVVVVIGFIMYLFVIKSKKRKI